MDRLRFGISNKISAATVTASNEQNAMPVTNIQDNTLSFFKAISGTCLVTIALQGASQVISFLSLHRINFSSLVITGKKSGGTVFTSQTVTSADFSGIDENHYVMDKDLNGDIDTIELAFTGAIPAEIGYVFVGATVDFSIFAMQPFDESTDAPVPTNGNTISTNLGYSFRRYTVTVGYETFESIRTKIRSVFKDVSFAEPRGVEISGDCIPSDYLLGLLDSGVFGYSINNNSDENGDYKAQITIGIRESLGGNS